MGSMAAATDALDEEGHLAVQLEGRKKRQPDSFRVFAVDRKQQMSEGTCLCTWVPRSLCGCWEENTEMGAGVAGSHIVTLG